MKLKGYKRTRCEKRTMSKCADGVARTYNAIESKYAEIVYDTVKIPKKSIQLPQKKRGNFPK